MKKLLALLLAVMLVFTVAGCEKAVDKLVDKLGEETPSTTVPADTTTPADTTIPVATEAPVASGVIGTYKLVDMVMSGEKVPLESAPTMTLTVNADGTANMYNGIADTPLTWTQNGNQISLVGDTGVPDVFAIQGNHLVYDNAGIYMDFAK